MIQVVIFESGFEFTISFHAAVLELLGKKNVHAAVFTSSTHSSSVCCIFMRMRFYM